MNLYSSCIDCGFKKFQNMDKKELSNLLKQYYCVPWSAKKKDFFL